MEELLETLSAVRKKDERDKRFQAALAGANLDEEEAEEEDITKITGVRAKQDGFGIGLGLGHMVEE